MIRRPSRVGVLIALGLSGLLPGCRPAGPAGREVVAYVSLDEPYARPLLEAFQQESGIRVRTVYDTEAGKSRGLAERLLAERGRPRADVFWSSEVLQTVRLGRRGVLAEYRPPSAQGIPAAFRDRDGRWTGFAARFRVFIHHTRRGPRPPRTLRELAEPRWRGVTAMANPLFGTSTTEALVLFSELGDAAAESYYRRRLSLGTSVTDGNSVAAERVARGDADVAQTDTDDAYVRLDAGRPVGIVFPDQEGAGALLIPNTVGLVEGAPRPDEGRRLVDFLVSTKAELLLSRLSARQLPLHTGLESQLPERVQPLVRVRRRQVDYSSLADRYETVDAILRELFLR